MWLRSFKVLIKNNTISIHFNILDKIHYTEQIHSIKPMHRATRRWNIKHLQNKHLFVTKSWCFLSFMFAPRFMIMHRWFAQQKNFDGKIPYCLLFLQFLVLISGIKWVFVLAGKCIIFFKAVIFCVLDAYFLHV